MTTDAWRRAQMRWQLTNPAVRVAIAALATLAAALVAYASLNIGSDMDATAASVLVAVVFGVATVVFQRQAQRRQNTIELVTNQVASDRIASADAWLADHAIMGQQITDEVVAFPEQRRQVATALDQYELLAVLARKGLLDVPLLLDLVGGTMIRTFRQCQPYIEHRRSTDAPYLYTDLELFADVYGRRRPPSAPASAT